MALPPGPLSGRKRCRLNERLFMSFLLAQKEHVNTFTDLFELEDTMKDSTHTKVVEVDCDRWEMPTYSLSLSPILFLKSQCHCNLSLASFVQAAEREKRDQD